MIDLMVSLRRGDMRNGFQGKVTKSSGVGYLLAFFLGGLGLHLFYYKKYVRGGIYLFFCWTFIPIILGWIDMFFIKKWTQQLNYPDSKSIEKHGDMSQGNRKFQAPVTHGKKTAIHSVSSQSAKQLSSTLFIDEDAIILPKYIHLKTPLSILKSILDAVNPKNQKDVDSQINRFEISYTQSGKKFIKDSVRYAKKKGKKTAEVQLQAYWTTFDHFDDKKLKWYLYWREEVLKGNYLEVDLSYIFVFVYELINYSFNQKAAFNVSALVRIYENYIEMHPKLDNYLPRWIQDMLNELNEEELANEWSMGKNILPIYKRIVEDEIPLDKISITNWKPYIRNYRETAFFAIHKNKIYRTFKSGIVLLKEHYDSENKEISEVWFETKKTREVVHLFSGAVMGRKIEPIHLYSNEMTVKKAFYDEVTTLFRLAENITRELNGEHRKIKVEVELLPDNFQEKLRERLTGKSEPTISRFKTVRSKDKDVSGSFVPKSPVEPSQVEVSDLKTLITFDESNINRLNNENQELQKLFDELEFTVDPQDNPFESTFNSMSNIIDGYNPENKLNNNIIGSRDSIDSYFENIDSDEEGFIHALSSIEKEFLTSLDNGECSYEQASAILRQKGKMIGTFLNELNEKANEHLGDNIIEVEQDKIILYEEFTSVTENLRGARR